MNLHKDVGRNGYHKESVPVREQDASYPDGRKQVYETASVIRQIEGGLFSMQWLMFGIAAGLFAGAFFASAGSPFRLRWLSGMGWLSVLASIDSANNTE